MAKARKTIKVETVKKRVNWFLLHSPDRSTEAREVMASMLTGLLLDTGNYDGFNYLTPTMMEKSNLGKSVGINVTAGTMEEKFKETDRTRVYYY